MEALYARCGGVDVHKKSVTVCLLTPGPAGRPTKESRPSPTTTGALLARGDWLAAAGCTHVAMERTGVYWKPLWNLWEERFTLLLVNAQQVKAVPGRKTDARDCEWLADLLRHGLVRSSFVPDRPQRELRELNSLPGAAGRRADRRGQPRAADLGGGQPQTGHGRHRHHGGVGAGDPDRAGRGRDRCGGAGRLGGRPPAQQTDGVGAGPGRSVRSPSALPDRRAIGAS